MQMEYDVWTAAPMDAKKPSSFDAEISVSQGTRTLDLVTVHAHTENGSTLTLSSPAIRLTLE